MVDTIFFYEERVFSLDTFMENHMTGLPEIPCAYKENLRNCSLNLINSHPKQVIHNIMIIILLQIVKNRLQERLQEKSDRHLLFL